MMEGQRRRRREQQFDTLLALAQASLAKAMEDVQRYIGETRKAMELEDALMGVDPDMVVLAPATPPAPRAKEKEEEEVESIDSDSFIDDGNEAASASGAEDDDDDEEEEDESFSSSSEEKKAPLKRAPPKAAVKAVVKKPKKKKPVARRRRSVRPSKKPLRFAFDTNFKETRKREREAEAEAETLRVKAPSKRAQDELAHVRDMLGYNNWRYAARHSTWFRTQYADPLQGVIDNIGYRGGAIIVDALSGDPTYRVEALACVESARCFVCGIAGKPCTSVLCCDNDDDRHVMGADCARLARALIAFFAALNDSQCPADEVDRAFRDVLEAHQEKAKRTKY